MIKPKFSRGREVGSSTRGKELFYILKIPNEYIEKAKVGKQARF